MTRKGRATEQFHRFVVVIVIITGKVLGFVYRGMPRRGLTQSMGRSGSLDNAVSEAFNSALERELLRYNHFATCEQGDVGVAAWIDEDNSDRRYFHQRHAQPRGLRTRLRNMLHAATGDVLRNNVYF